MMKLRARGFLRGDKIVCLRQLLPSCCSAKKAAFELGPSDSCLPESHLDCGFFSPVIQSQTPQFLCFLCSHSQFFGFLSDLVVVIFQLTPHSLTNNAIILYFKTELGSKVQFLFPFPFFILKTR